MRKLLILGRAIATPFIIIFLVFGFFFVIGYEIMRRLLNKWITVGELIAEILERNNAQEQKVLQEKRMP